MPKLIKFTEAEITAMTQNRILRDIDVDPAKQPEIALGVLLDNGTWDGPPFPRTVPYLKSAIRKLAAYVSQHYEP